ncbi:N-acetylneuraminate lyase [Prosthecobacter debontii]|uniref:N-acetylneuraminate lyase n=1 Tax=Prosthecobacter debontii TaxID=48467 RepID=A0A1T4XKB3_9BACT|nr:dihydrodipicolinate synthase family protein [Prosthecobacter debontii]SKA89853.1 N-acetylneuraminate lyase [Prosthecobacter debontii]
MLSHPIHGLVAATHTPFHTDGSLNLAVVEQQAAHLQRTGISAAFIGGTTGESHSLSLAERQALTERWMEVTRGSSLKVVVHVGANCLGDVADLAAQAQELGADAISALAPSYFKPRSVSALVECCAQITSAAPELPFFLYDIPSFTGISLSMPEFLTLGKEALPTLAGIKFTNPDGMMFQQCLHHSEGAFSILWGTDECLLAGLALGATGAVGSTYNFAAPIYQRITAAFERHDFATARAEQKRSVELVARLASIGYMSAAKAVMKMLGVDVGPARLPHGRLDAAQEKALQTDLEAMGFFEWVK